MKIYERHNPGDPWLLYFFGNLLAIDGDLMDSIGVAWLFKEEGRWRFLPRITGDRSLYYNAVVFFRVAFPGIWPTALFLWYVQYVSFGWFIPFGLFGGFRWSPRSDARAFWQGGLGWKINGRPGIIFRISSDGAALKGTTGPNFGQSWGFEYGPH